MEKFKIKSIDEFDVDFVAKYNQPAAVVPEAETDSNINIDDIAPETQAENPEIIAQSEAPVVAQPQAVPQNPPAPVQPEKKDEKKKKPEKVKQSGLAITGKVIATILLVATVVTFVFGCFTSVFLDNSALDLGISISTVNSDTKINSVSEEVQIFSKGDLVISKKEDNLKYAEIFNEASYGEDAKLIYLTYTTVPDNEEYYSDVYRLTGVTSSSESNTVLTAVNLSSGNYEAIEINTDSKDFHGLVTSFYIPMLGGILHFANDYAILVCILFILMAAFWCLILILIDNQRGKSKKSKSKSKK